MAPEVGSDVVTKAEPREGFQGVFHVTPIETVPKNSAIGLVLVPVSAYFPFPSCLPAWMFVLAQAESAFSAPLGDVG